MQKIESEVERKTTKDYARELADELSYSKPFIKEDNRDDYGRFCCLPKWGGVYTVAYDTSGDITIEMSVLDGWDTIWHGQWNPETDIDAFVQRIWNGETGDELTEKDDDDEDEDLTDEESETEMDDIE